MKTWSTRYVIDPERKIATFPTLTHPDWVAAHQWAQKDKKITSKSKGDLTVYLIPAANENRVSKEDRKQRKHPNLWASFSDFTRFFGCAWIVSITGEEWRTGSCTCPYWLKHFKCKHSIGIAIRARLVKAPQAARQVKLGSKPKRGRPKKASKALQRD